MKPINEWTLTECLDAIRRGDYLNRHEIADRIHELTRWIPVSERLPTIDDADERGNVLWRSLIMKGGVVICKWDMEPTYHGRIVRTHWKRIDKP